LHLRQLTGSAGQLGSYLVEHFADEYEVVGIDKAVPKFSISKRQTVIGDLLDHDLVRRLVSDKDIIIHAAAQVSVEKSIIAPIEDAKNNILATINLLKAASESNAKRFIYISSAAVFGVPKYLPIDEGHPVNPLSPYGVSKLTGERYCMVFHNLFNLPVVCIRPFNIYSKRQDPNSPYSGVITKFIERVKNKKRPVIYGDGKQTRDFVSVFDVVHLIELAMTNENAIGEVFNCATGAPTSINELADIIIKLLGKDMKPIYEAPRKGDIKESYADISKAARILGYEPKCELKDGLKDMI
jgi:UDP-glucose 4-epimerase